VKRESGERRRVLRWMYCEGEVRKKKRTRRY